MDVKEAKPLFKLKKVDGWTLTLTFFATLAMGAVAGGCNFLAFYPKSPSMAVAVLFAEHAKEFGIIVEQA